MKPICPNEGLYWSALNRNSVLIRFCDHFVKVHPSSFVGCSRLVGLGLVSGEKLHDHTIKSIADGVMG